MATNNTLNTTNISNLVPPEINATVNTIHNPKAFGDQLKNYAKQKAIQASLGIVDKIRKEIEDTVRKKINLEVDHVKNLLELEKKGKPQKTIYRGEVIESEPILTEEEYNEAVAIENKRYEEAKLLLQKEQDNLNERLLKILTDPYAKAKAKYKKLKENLKKRKNRSEEEKRAARAKRLKQLKQFAKKTLVPVVTALLQELLIKIITESDRLQELVDQTNNAIESASTPEEINQARILRDNALKSINEVEKNIIELGKRLSQIQLYVTIFDGVATAILSIPIPASVPPGIGVPVNFILKLQQTLIKAQKIAEGISSVLSIMIPLLEDAIYVLEDLKQQLLDINVAIDGKTTNNLSNAELTGLLSSIQSLQQKFQPYKGFRFEIKQEQNQKFVVKGNKRHYAIAIDSNGTEILKSDYSFTLDPNDLVNQLKLIIDQRNLQG